MDACAEVPPQLMSSLVCTPGCQIRHLGSIWRIRHYTGRSPKSATPGQTYFLFRTRNLLWAGPTYGGASGACQAHYWLKPLHQEEGKSLIWTKFRLNRTQPANGDLWRLA